MNDDDNDDNDDDDDEIGMFHGACFGCLVELLVLVIFILVYRYLTT